MALFWCDSLGFLEEGRAAMEVLIGRKEGIEDKNERCNPTGAEIETFAALIEEERLQSNSSSYIFLTSEMTGHEEEEQSHNSSESSSPPSLGSLTYWT
ncbi:hypothetical protein CFP56_043285 [Quercus suber]|uniref:Uncharacterized protein n=1 Tax=Quercus suber TaxID=58331 RepID=A0AAW0LI17_QUESU